MGWLTNSPNDKDYSDVELIEGCIRGKTQFQELLYKRFFSFAMSICVRYAPNTSEAMEVVNDSYIKMFDNLHAFDTQKPFKSWFAKILVNSAIDSYRRSQKNLTMLPIEQQVTTNGADPEIESELSANDILKLFAELPETYRVTFNLYEIEGYSHEEIGQMMGITTSTSRSNLTRAKQMLKALYSKNIEAKTKCHETV